MVNVPNKIETGKEKPTFALKPIYHLTEKNYVKFNFKTRMVFKKKNLFLLKMIFLLHNRGS